jgi:hypothetical protein
MRPRKSTKRSFLAAMTWCALLIGSPQAPALEYQRIPLKLPTAVILAQGPIVEGDAERLAAFIGSLAQTDRVTSLLVNSPGGNVAEAENLARVIIEYKLSVFVPPGSQCSSACFLLFAAASSRFAAPNAVIGVHSASLVNGEETITSLALTTIMARDLAQDGVPNAIVGKLVTTPPGHTTWLTASDFAAMGVQFVNDPRWR